MTGLSDKDQGLSERLREQVPVETPIDIARMMDAAADALQAASEREAKLREEVARFRGDRNYVVGFNDGYAAAERALLSKEPDNAPQPVELVEHIRLQEIECERLRKDAHEAPLNPLRTNHDGHRWVEQQSTAWADRSREWAKAKDKLDALRSRVRASPLSDGGQT